MISLLSYEREQKKRATVPGDLNLSLPPDKGFPWYALLLTHCRLPVCGPTTQQTPMHPSSLNLCVATPVSPPYCPPPFFTDALTTNKTMTKNNKQGATTTSRIGCPSAASRGRARSSAPSSAMPPDDRPYPRTSPPRLPLCGPRASGSSRLPGPPAVMPPAQHGVEKAADRRAEGPPCRRACGRIDEPWGFGFCALLFGAALGSDVVSCAA